MNRAPQFIPPHPLNTAVLFLVFNRLDTTKQVFGAIRNAKPPRLYIAADGARENKDGEAEKVQAVRDFILQSIDWECDVKTLFRDKNLGCKNAINSALEWFFENEEQGIILEDDCLPNQSFFWYCETLLEKYKNDARIGQVSGFNIFSKNEELKESYMFLTGGPIWGWATWRRVYKQLEIYNHTSLDDIYQAIYGFTDDLNESNHIRNNLELVRSGKLSTWDYDWGAMLKANSQLSIVPRVNLVTNVGFGEDATHTTTSDISTSNNCGADIDVVNMKHPSLIATNKKLSKQQASYHAPSGLLRTILTKLKKLL